MTIMTNYKVKLKNIKAFVFDVDGVLTDGSIICMPETGDLVRTFNAKDGLGMRLAYMSGYTLAILTGGQSDSILKRFYPVLAHEVIQNVQDKAPVFEDFCKRHNLYASEVAYVGDDLPDIPVLKICGLAVCPSDAVAEVKGVCDFVSQFPGGRGCVRDLIEQVMKAQGKWTLDASAYQTWRRAIDKEYNRIYNKR